MGCSMWFGSHSSRLRGSDVLLTLQSAFDNDEVLHVDDSVDPVRDLSNYFLSTFLLTNVDDNRHHPERTLQKGSWYDIQNAELEKLD
jgi:ribosome-binding ATPase YchF (GTP1/OBG family)